MDLLEGGIRVPYIVRWPARLPAGETYDRLAIGMDWMATFIAAAGVAAHPDYPLDGIDLFGEEVERNLYWRMIFRNQKAVRSGVWKYLSIEGSEFLYDLSRDERERANMRYREPEKFEELRKALLRMGCEYAAETRRRRGPFRIHRSNDGKVRRLVRPRKEIRQRRKIESAGSRPAPMPSPRRTCNDRWERTERRETK